MLAVAAIGPGTAFAQAPVVPTTTVAAQPDDESKSDHKDGEDKSKVEQPNVEATQGEKPKVEAPDVEKAEAPTFENPNVEVPKAAKSGKPDDDKPKLEKAKPAPPKAKLERPKPSSAKPEKPRPAQSKPAQPMSGQASAPSPQPNGARPAPRVEVAKPVSPRSKGPPSLAASSVRHVTVTRRTAAKQNRKAASRLDGAASPPRPATSSARSGRDFAAVTAAASGPISVAETRAVRLASHGVAAAAGTSLDREQPHVLSLAPPAGYNVTLLLAIVFAAGVGFLVGREVRRGPGPRARR
jgi:hypothetical protein